MSTSLTGVTATTIDKYVGRAESAVREDVAASTSSTAAAGTTARVNDIVTLADKADTLFFTYGSDARYQSVAQALTTSVTDKSLASYGKGKDLTVTDAKVATATATLENGTTRTTTNTTNLAVYDYTAAEENNGVGKLSLYRELVITGSDGNAKAGTALASSERVEQNTSVYEADVANKTLTVTTNLTATTKASNTENVTTEQVTRVTVFKQTEAGDYEQTIRERYFSTTTNAVGELVGTTARETTTVNTLNATTGQLTINRTDDTVAGSVTATGAQVTTGAYANLNITINAEGGKVGDVTIKEKLQNTVSTQRDDGSTQISQTNRSTTYTGEGQKAVSANTTYAGAASWVKADGSVGAGANSTGASFKLDGATEAQADVVKAAANGYAASGGTTAAGDVELRAQADQIAYTEKKGLNVKVNEDLQQVTIKASELAAVEDKKADKAEDKKSDKAQVVDDKAGSKAAEKFAAQAKQAETIDPKKLANELEKNSVGYQIVDGKVVIGALNAKGNGPVAVVDFQNNLAVAQIGNRGYAKADGIAQTLLAARTAKGNGTSVNLLDNTVTNVEKDTKKRGYLAIQSSDDGFAIGSKTGNKKTFAEVSPLRSLTV